MNEREFSSYVAGYVDGEGCFCVSVNPRPSLRIKWEVRPSFSVSQNSDRAEVLNRIKNYFKCGSIRRDYSDRTVKYEVRSLKDLIERVIPFFDRFPLISEKQQDFILLKKVCKIMAAKGHQTKDGLARIFELANKMNYGNRKYNVILEDIVNATSNSGGREVPTRTNGITIWKLSQRGAR